MAFAKKPNKKRPQSVKLAEDRKSHSEKSKKNRGFFGNRAPRLPKNEIKVEQKRNTRIERASVGAIFDYNPRKVNDKDFLSTVELMDTMRIVTTVKGHPVQIGNNYTGYVQFLEVQGRDLASLSRDEQEQVINDFTRWLSQFNYDVTFETTTLPTNTRSQLIESQRILQDIQRQLNNLDLSEHEYRQLKDREEVQRQNIIAQEEISNKLYNAEFLLWLYADSIEELDRLVRAARAAGNATYSPSIVSDEKKIQIIKQYNNQNERV